MDYDHTPERAREIMRDAMPWMNKQTAAAHPVSYAVWYDYVSGENPSLSHAVDQHLATHPVLDEAVTKLMFDKFIADIDIAAAENATRDADKVFTEVATSADQVRRQAARYRETLTVAGKRLASVAVGAELDILLEATNKTADTVEALCTQLERRSREIERLQAELHRAKRDAMHDSLTGLANRRFFNQRAEGLIAMAELANMGLPLCVALVDIDHFKRVNDTHGHGFGDDVIVNVALTVAAVVPKEALCARVGGEEIAVIMPATPMEHAVSMVENARRRIEAKTIDGRDGRQTSVTVSGGVTTWLRGDDLRSLMDRADRALYLAKAAGRNCVMSRED